MALEQWSSRYLKGTIPWDLGHISNPIQKFFGGLSDKTLRVLIPGAGNSYEAEYLWNRGFKNVHVVDVSRFPLESLKSRAPSFPEGNLHCQDFFVHEGQYDLVIEQTFFCALSPKLRVSYARKMRELLSHRGRICGLWFKFPLSEKGPPFGGSQEEYQLLFGEYFKSVRFEPCQNSEVQRKGAELWGEVSDPLQ